MKSLSRLFAIAFVALPAVAAGAQNPGRQTLPDLSGLAWIGGNRFLSVHDAKAPGATRASLVLAPDAYNADLGHPLKVQNEGPEPFDLECCIRIPQKPEGPAGPPAFLLLESGSNQERRRIFRTTFNGDGDTLRLETLAYLPERREVEGAALAWYGDKLMVFFADRGEGKKSVEIEWAEVRSGQTLIPLGSVKFKAPVPVEEHLRLVSSLEVDSDGELYSASAIDNGDAGPFRSKVWHIGKLKTKHGEPDVKLLSQPELLATLDGLKAESLAIRETGDHKKELFVGTDDEFYGGVMRLIGPLERE